MSLVAGIVAVAAGILLLVFAAPRQRKADTRVGRYLGGKTIFNALALVAVGIVLIVRS
ncbi:MAG: hypothetical protein M3Z84_03720 [Actinomycetota bacterium]|nr:hypothetical protein [Actinomycetota bacterium]